MGQKQNLQGMAGHTNFVYFIFAVYDIDEMKD